ncbi:MAG: choice-of-anchor Q domain-containing protein [Solirubrobacteraceae bacterium]
MRNIVNRFQIVLRGATLSAAMAFVGMPANAGAETFRVTRFDDPAPASCIPGNCTLREAVNASNNNGPGAHDTIVLPSATYTLQRHYLGHPSALGGALVVLNNLTIDGAGSEHAVIDGNGRSTGDRVFDVLGGGLELHHVDVTGGIGSADVDGHRKGGGVLLKTGAFYMYDGMLRGNSVPHNNDLGGGLYNAGGHAVFVRSVISGNTAPGGVGGGIFTGASPGALTEIHDSKLSGNQAGFGGALASMGGPAGNVSVSTSQISYNRAEHYGGAVYAAGDLGGAGGVEYDIRNVTINGNVADVGGAIRVEDTAATLNNDTIYQNSATIAGGIFGYDDGHDFASVSLHNTILGKNTASNHPDCQVNDGSAPTGIMHSKGYNIIGDVTGCNELVQNRGIGDSIGTNVSPVDPKLDTTAFNGGPFPMVLTARLLTGSPAIDKGDPASTGGCEFTDARDIQRSLGGRCDIGAYELVPATATTGMSSAIRTGGATLAATVQTYAPKAQVYFQFGRTRQYGRTTSPQTLVSSGTPRGISAARVVTTRLTGLQPNTTYHFRIVVITRNGIRHGTDRMFRTKHV